MFMKRIYNMSNESQKQDILCHNSTKSLQNVYLLLGSIKMLLALMSFKEQK